MANRPFEALTKPAEKYQYPNYNDYQKFMKDMEEEKETQCPCCKKKYNITYKRKLSKAMVLALKKLNSSESITAINTGDFAKLEHWKLIEKTSDKPYYKITPLGIDFINGIYKVPKYIVLKNNKPISYTGQFVTINDILRG